MSLVKNAFYEMHTAPTHVAQVRRAGLVFWRDKFGALALVKVQGRWLHGLDLIQAVRCLTP